MEIEVLEDQWRDGRTGLRIRNGPLGCKPCSWWWWWVPFFHV